MSDEHTFSLVQRAARRWTHERGDSWSAHLGPAIDDAQSASLLRELSEQGWLPDSLAEWGGSPAALLVRLVRVLSRDVPAACLPILTHTLGLQLLGGGANLGASSSPIACSPYMDHSRCPADVTAIPCNGGWVLDGQAYWVINARPGCLLVLVAELPDGDRGVFAAAMTSPGCSLGGPLASFGLWGVPARHVQLSSVQLPAENLVADGRRASGLIDDAYRTLRWGVLALLCGVLERMHEHALSYSEIRSQGGRRIVDHPPVRQLLDAARNGVDVMARELTRFELVPGADYCGAEMRRQARLASDSALQVYGGIGYMCPGLSERCWRDVRQATTLGGGICF